MMLDEKPVASPCVQICSLDEEDVCIGCHRSADEIRRWGRMDSHERRRVLQMCNARARAAGVLIEVAPSASGDCANCTAQCNQTCY